MAVGRVDVLPQPHARVADGDLVPGTSGYATRASGSAPPQSAAASEPERRRCAQGGAASEPAVEQMMVMVAGDENDLRARR